MRILCVADIHAGSTVAPWPDITLEGGGKWQPGAAQRWLNRCWKNMIAAAEQYKPDVVVVLGDEIDGANARNSGIVTPRWEEQQEAAEALLQPLREMTDKFYMVRGTGWHVGQGAKYSSAVAQTLEAVRTPNEEWTWPELLLGVHGYCIHFAHHIGSTGNPMYEATAVMNALMVTRLEMANKYRYPPDIRGVVRAHRHRMISVSKGHLHGATVTGWQLKTDYGYKVAPNSLSEIGYLTIDAGEEGIERIQTHLFPLPKPRVEEA